MLPRLCSTCGTASQLRQGPYGLQVTIVQCAGVAHLGKSLKAEAGALTSPVGIHTLSPGMVLTDLLLDGATYANKQIFNILCEQVGHCCRIASLAPVYLYVSPLPLDHVAIPTSDAPACCCFTVPCRQAVMPRWLVAVSCFAYSLVCCRVT